MGSKLDIRIKKEDFKKKLDIKDGYTPIKNVDYFDGKDGYTPIKGKDYFDGSKGDRGDKGETTIVDRIIERTEVIKEQPIFNTTEIVREVTNKITTEEINNIAVLINPEIEYSKIKGIPNLSKLSGGLNRITREEVQIMIDENDTTHDTLQGVTDRGATTTNVITVPGVQFNTNPPAVTMTEGLLRWNNTDRTLNLGMGDAGVVTQQIGQELFILGVNKTASPLTEGSVVYMNGRQGLRPKFVLARGDAEATSQVLGVITENIAVNAEGFVTTFGYVRGIKTNYSGSGIWGTTWAEGDTLWLSKTTAGQLTNVEPAVPHHADIVGSVGVIHGTQGSIFVSIQKHRTLEELSDVDGTPLATTGQIPVWNNTGKYFDFNYNITNYWKKDGSSTATGNWTGMGDKYLQFARTNVDEGGGNLADTNLYIGEMLPFPSFMGQSSGFLFQADNNSYGDGSVNAGFAFTQGGILNEFGVNMDQFGEHTSGLAGVSLRMDMRPSLEYFTFEGFSAGYILTGNVADGRVWIGGSYSNPDTTQRFTNYGTSAFLDEVSIGDIVYQDNMEKVVIEANGIITQTGQYAGMTEYLGNNEENSLYNTTFWGPVKINGNSEGSTQLTLTDYIGENSFQIYTYYDGSETWDVFGGLKTDASAFVPIWFETNKFWVNGAGLSTEPIVMLGNGDGTGTPATSDTLQVYGSSALGDVYNGNYSKFEADGTLVFNGTATVYDDIQFSISTGKVPAANAPTWSTWNSLSEYSFAVNDYIDLGAQELKHDWKEGSAIELHIHWSTGTGNYVNGDKVKWQLEYTWANMKSSQPFSAFPAPTTVSAEQAFTTTVAPYSHVYTSIASFTPTGGTIGSQLKLRLKRIAKSAGGTDPGTAPFALQVGLHYEIDTCGSRTVSGK